MKTFLDDQMKCSPSIVNLRRASRAANRFVTWATIAIVGVLANIAYTVPSFAQILGTAQLNIERRGHTATLLEDGKVLIVGGDNQSGMVSQAELLDPASQTSSLSATLIVARTDHTAIRLADARVLVIGGRGQNGSLTSTEIYDPMTATFTAGPSLTTPRSGHTVTVLSDQKILVAGGDAISSAELYDPVTQSFSPLAGSMNAGRKFHSAILTSSSQVLIVGGVNAQNTVLNTAEVYDPSSQSFYLPPTDLKTPRALATLKLLSDGKVQVIGGDADFSMEIFDPELGWFNALALLPPTVDSLGATLSTQSRAALFSPTISQDQFLQGALTSDHLTLLDRADHSITELPAQNKALVAGGINSSGQILKSATFVSSSSASITTDKTDYAPGSVVTITGKGFQPNEQVAISLHETPEGYPDPAFVATVDDQGNFVSMQFSPQTIDLNRTFTMTAIGQSSSFTAQTAFTDGNAHITGTVKSSATGNPPISGATVSCTTTSGCNANLSTTTAANGSYDLQVTFVGTSGSVTLTASATGFTSATLGPIAVSNNVPVSGKNFILTPSVAATTTSISAPTITYNANGSVTVTVSSTAGTPTGNVTLAVDGGIPVSKALLSGSATFTNTDIAALTSPSAGDHTLSASYAAQGSFAASSATGSLHVNQAPSVTTMTCPANVTYNGAAQTPCSATVTGAGGLSLTPTPTYANNTNVGTASASYTYAGDANHTGSSDSKNFAINPAPSVTTVIFETGPYAYRGTAFTATANVTGVGGLNQAVAVVYSGDCTHVTNTNGCTATATFTGDTNHTGSSDSKSITITTGFAFNGFYLPIGGSVESGNGGSYADPLKAFKLGSTIPVKFGATWLNGGAALITGIHTLQAVKYSNSTDSDPPIDATPTDSATTGNQFRLTGTDWHFNLSTKGNGFTAGTWLLRATLEDGSQHTVWISIKK